MAVPTHRLRQFDGSEVTTLFDSPAERKGALTGDATVNHGNPPAAGAELTFGTIDISGGQADSALAHIRWDVTADGGNTLAEDFKVWLLAADNGFTSATTIINFQPISGADQATPTLTKNYVQNAVKADYATWLVMPATEPGTRNLYPTDEGTSMVLSTTSDDAVVWSNYLQIGSDEVTGTYKAADAGKEFRDSFKFSYS